MLENLIKLVTDNAGDAIINNPAIPNDQNQAAIETTASSIMDSLKGQIGSGGLDSIMNLFQGGGASGSGSMVENITSGVAGNLMKKFGIDNAAANGIVQSLVPVVMNKLVHKTNDPEDSSFNLTDILSTLGGNSASGGGGILNTIKGLFGGNN